MKSRLYWFVGGDAGAWRVRTIDCIAGRPLAEVARLAVVSGLSTEPPGATWLLRGITSNERYVEHAEKDRLVARQAGLGRPEAVCAALIPIRKNAVWWSLSQDERREIFEEQSRHIQIGLDYLPAVARRLHHCRDLGENEPFDFLTWFEYAPGDEPGFNELVAHLRASPEWAYVDREIDIRLLRSGGDNAAEQADAPEPAHS